MKNIIFIMLFLTAFTIDASAQEVKAAQKKELCCAMQVADKSDKKSKCDSEVTLSPVENNKGCGATEASNEPNPAPGATQTATAAQATEKKSCNANASCCGAKAPSKV